MSNAIDALEHRQLLAAHIVGSTVVYSTIQGAVDAATAGATVTVDAGNYTEKVVISKALTIKGAKAGVDARSTARTGSGESVVTGVLSSGVRSTSFYINANNVTIDGFTVQGETSQNLTVGAGIVITANHNGTKILNNIVQNNVAGLFLSNNSTTNPALIQYNLFKSNNNAGTNGGRGIYTDDSIFGTTLTNVTIDSNSFINNYGGTGTTGLEAAVALESSTTGKQTNIRITNNTMSGNGKALLAYNATNLLIQGNSITTTQDQYSGTVRFEGNVQNVTIKYNSIYANTGPGVAIDAKAVPGTSSGFVINFNNFHGNNSAYTVPISVVFDQTTYSGVLDARNNWWGSTTGPSGNGPGTGDAASAGVFQSGNGLGWKLVTGGSLLYSPFSTAPNAPPGVLPTAPIAPGAAGSGLAQVTVFWTDTAGEMASGFVIERSTDGTTFTQVGSTGFGITRFVDTSAVAGATYSYRVAAINSNGASPFAAVVTASTPVAGSTLTNLSTQTWVSATTGWGVVQKDESIAGNPLKIGSVNYARGLGTHAVSQIVYNVAKQYSRFMSDIGIDAEEDTKGTGQVIFRLVGDGKVLYDSGIVYGITEPISISVDITGVSTLTLVADSGIPGDIDFDHADWGGATLVAPPPPAVPAAPTNLSVVAVSATQVNLSWTSTGSDVTGFVIQRSTDGTNFATIATTTTPATTYADLTVAATTGYTYRVAAVNAVGPSAYSGFATVTTPAVPAVPPVPTGLSAIAISTTQVNLAWTSTGTDVTGFAIQRSTDGINFTPLATTTTAATTYSDITVVASTAYTYRVAAINVVGTSDFSLTASVTTPAALPPVPTALSAVASSPTQVSLSWTSSGTDVTGFLIQRSTDGVNFAPIATTTTPATSYLDSPVAPNSAYTYRVAAINAAGTSGFSIVASVTTPPAPTVPAAPTGLIATAPSHTQVTLTWNTGAADVTGYVIERSTDGINFTPLATTTTPATTYADTAVAPSTAYWYHVAAINAVGTSDFSASATVTTLAAPTVPAAPTGLTAIALSHTQVTLAWSSSGSDVTGFAIERSTDGINFTPLVTTTTAATTYLDNTVAANTAYTYHVAAINAVGTSDFSLPASVTTPSAPVLPPVPTGLTATASSATQVALAWTSTGTDVTGFVIQRSTDGINFAPLATTTTPATTYLDNSVAPNTSYTYRVAAVNAAGTSDFSLTASATTPVALPAVPTGVTAAATSATQVSLAWTSGADATGFVIQRSTDGINFATVATTTAPATSYLDNSVAPSTGYTYRVAAVNAAGTSDFSLAASATTPSALPAAPTGLTATASSATQVALAWTSSGTGITGFVIQRSTSGTSFTTIATTTTPATSYTDGTVVGSTSYTYRVAAINAAGTSDFSGVASVTTPVAPPTAPTALTATASSQTQVDLAWSATGTNATGFVIQRSTNGTTFTQIGTTTGLTTYSDKTVVASSTYYYRVASTNAAGTSAYSTVVSVTTPSPSYVATNLSALTWVSATSGWNSVQKDKSVAGNPLILNGVTYTTGIGTHAVSNIVYNLGGQYARFRSDIGVDYAEKTKGGSIIFSVIGDGKTLYTSPTLTNLSATVSIDVDITGVQQLTLVATNGIANNIDYDHADWAGAKLMSLGNVAPAAPSNLTATASSATQVNLSWKNNANNATGFIIQRATGSGAFTQIGTTTASTNTYTDSTAVASTTYSYRVLATTGVTNSTASNTATITTPSATSVTTNLSSLTWTSATSGYLTVQKDKSILSKTLTLRGKTYTTGLGTHAVSNIVYNLAGKYKTFVSDIGVDDEVIGKGTGSVIFQVIGDGKVLYDSGVLTNNSAIVSLNLNVTGVTTLTLVAKNGVTGIDYDHADWAGAKLIS